MSFADPQTITSLGGFTSLARTGSGKNVGSFSSSDGTIQLDVASSYNPKRTRRTIKMSQTKVSADVLIPANNVRNFMTAYVVVDTPVNGFSVVEAKAVVDTLVAYLAASTGARVTQLLGGEN